jgi:hypothetical protein
MVLTDEKAVYRGNQYAGYGQRRKYLNQGETVRTFFQTFPEQLQASVMYPVRIHGAIMV